MFNRQILSDLIESRKVKKVDLYTYADISKNSLDNILLGKNEPSVKSLERFADFFRVPIDQFFDREIELEQSVGHTVTGNGNSVSGDISINECKMEVKHLNELLAEKERMIKVLMKTVGMDEEFSEYRLNTSSGNSYVNDKG